MKNKLFYLGVLLILLVPSRAPGQSISDSVQFFRLQDVRLLNSPFKRAQQVDLSYMLQLDPDRLLAPYLKTAGLRPKAENYPNWESQGLDGHIAGHYLSALSMMYASTGNKRLLQRVKYIVHELALCQKQDSSGYIGGIPNGKKMWEKVKDGNVEAINSRWVPWYNVHKIFCGLRDAYLFTGNETAKSVLVKLSDWCWKETHNLTDEQMQKMLQTEYGGMNKVLADVAAITGNMKYLKLAKRFSKRTLLDPLLKDRDELTGLHANTQIPIVLGFERIAQLSGNRSWQQAASFFWNTVVRNRTLVFGGNSVNEHFNPVTDFSKMITSPQGPETCNTYNMLKLTRMLYQATGNPKYMDYYERAVYNHILSSENLKKGGFVYFTPIRPRHYRVFSQPQTSFWCCVGTGMENHSKYGGTIYAHTEDALLVNLFIPSQLNWASKGVTLIQQNHFPDIAKTTFRIKVNEPVSFTLKIRYPSWVTKNKLRVSINGKKQEISAVPDSYVTIQRQWHSGDKITLRLPMETTMKKLPGNLHFVALMRGPIVLAARTGTADMRGEFADSCRMCHVASGKLFPLEGAPKLVGPKDSILAEVKPVKGSRMMFSAPKAIYPEKYKDLKLIPFFRIGGSRYMIYWQHVSRQNIKQAITKDKTLDRN